MPGGHNEYSAMRISIHGTNPPAAASCRKKKNLSFSVPRCLTGRSKGAKRGEEMFNVCEDCGSQAALLKLKYLRSALETALISPEK